jgi:hypothetical protein
MGMFDRPAPAKELTPFQQVSAAGELTADTIVAPWLKNATGYESESNQLKRIASDTDLSNGKAVQDTYNTLLAKNPQAANSWLKSVKPIIDQHMATQKASDTGTATNFDKKMAIYAQNPEMFKKLKEAGVFGGEGVTVNMPGKEQFEIGDPGKIAKNWMSQTKPERENLQVVGTLDGLIRQAREENNPAAWVAVETQFTKLVGDSRISEGEIKRLKALGSLPDRIANSLTTFVSGVPTEKRINQYADTIEWLEEYNWNKLNKIKTDTLNSYKAIFPAGEKESQNRLLQMVNPILNIGPNPATSTGRKEKRIITSLCSQLKTFSEAGDTDTANKIATGLKSKGITSCKNY